MSPFMQRQLSTLPPCPQFPSTFCERFWSMSVHKRDLYAESTKSAALAPRMSFIATMETRMKESNDPTKHSSMVLVMSLFWMVYFQARLVYLLLSLLRITSKFYKQPAKSNEANYLGGSRTLAPVRLQVPAQSDSRYDPPLLARYTHSWVAYE
jgi:hypothetical protein